MTGSLTDEAPEETAGETGGAIRAGSVSDRSLLVTGAQGFLWTGGAQLLSQSLHIAIRLILARLLLPADFGLVAMAVVLLSVTSLISDLGLGNALVQRPQLDESHRSTSFWFTGAVSLALFTVFCLGAPLASWFFDETRVTPILRALSLTLLLAAPESTYAALLMRRMDFKSLGLRQISATVVAGVAGVGSALAGLGAWSLVAHGLVQALTSSLLLAWRAGWSPRWRFSRQALEELWGFGKWVAGARALNYLNRNVDNLLIGRFLGARALGLYSFSYQAVLLPLVYVARPVAAVSFPTFAQIQNDRERCALAYLRTLEMITLVAWPLAALGAVASPAAVPLLAGEAWRAAIPIFQILSGVAALHAFMNLASSLFDALGQSRTGFRWTAFVVPVNLAGFAIGLAWGPVGVATGFLTAAFVLLPFHSLLVSRLIPLSLLRLGALFIRGALLSAGVAGAWWLLALGLEPHTGFLPLAATLAGTALLCFVLMLVLFRRALGSLRKVLVGWIGRRPPEDPLSTA